VLYTNKPICYPRPTKDNPRARGKSKQGDGHNKTTPDGRALATSPQTQANPQYVSHQHRPHYPPQHHFRKPLSPFGHLGSRQLLPQPSLPLGWPRRTHAHEPGAETATRWLGGAPTANWVPRDEFRPHAQESAETQRPFHKFRNVERHRPRQATVAAAGPLYARAQPSDAQPSDAQPSDAQPSDAQPSDAQPASCQPQRPSPRLGAPCPCLRSPNLVRAPRPSAIRQHARRKPTAAFPTRRGSLLRTRRSHPGPCHQRAVSARRSSASYDVRLERACCAMREGQ
jgi:hypothetical protein